RDRPTRRRRPHRRRHLALPQPRRRLPRTHRKGPHMTTHTLTPTLDRTAPARSRLAPLTAEAVFIGRSLTHTLRNGEAALMAVLLPVLLMAMFTWVFGGAIDPSGGYIDYVVPGIIL